MMFSLTGIKMWLVSLYINRSWLEFIYEIIQSLELVEK